MFTLKAICPVLTGFVNLEWNWFTPNGFCIPQTETVHLLTVSVHIKRNWFCPNSFVHFVRNWFCTIFLFILNGTGSALTNLYLWTVSVHGIGYPPEFLSISKGVVPVPMVSALLKRNWLWPTVFVHIERNLFTRKCNFSP